MNTLDVNYFLIYAKLQAGMSIRSLEITDTDGDFSAAKVRPAVELECPRDMTDGFGIFPPTVSPGLADLSRRRALCSALDCRPWATWIPGEI